MDAALLPIRGNLRIRRSFDRFALLTRTLREAGDRVESGDTTSFRGEKEG
jgi:hypothetical protein